jgi:starch phosphorylase
MSSLLSPNRLSEKAISDVLKDLALDLRWSFNHSADQLWARLDPDLWELTNNPWLVLQTISREKLQSVTADPNFQALLMDLENEKKAAIAADAWFQKIHPNTGISAVAYFSMEFMLSEALPIYSGGLGNVAGDQLKTASTLGVPVYGVGLLYQEGYFRQEIDAQGRQQALYPFNEPGQLPIRPLRQANGEWLRLALEFPSGKLWLRTWEVQVGRARLYLLDTNDPANIPAHRGITTELYGGGPELRLKQELILGIGGWRLLRACGLRPEVCHLNEGHAAFAVLERVRSYMSENKQPFDLALTITRAGNLFTTHTPVEAGFDRFAPDLLEHYLRNYAEKELSISFPELLALGRRNPNDPSEPFNMAYLAIHGAGAVNGVSRLHGQVSRGLFQPLFPRWPEREVPIKYVTNGVHVPSWDSAASDALWETTCGKDRWRDTTEDLETNCRRLGDSELWKLRTDERKSLVEFVRKLHARQVAGRGASPEELTQAGQIFEPNALTLGFARRFATYKRPNLLLRDPERLLKILTNREHAVQLVLAGKAHPQDYPGQEMIHQWVEFARRPEVHSRVVFLSDYDVRMAQHLVQGVDVWVNTPRRPWEASGTSGMKVLVNGGLNLSELDGWWAEAYSPEVGWALGDGRTHTDDQALDKSEAEALYELLEKNVIPEFYDRDGEEIPRGWVARMRASMSRLTPEFSSNRTVRQYTEEYYIATNAKFRRRAEKHGSLGIEILHWRVELEKHWASMRFGAATMEKQGDDYLFRVEVFFGEVNPEFVRVELDADQNSAGGAATEVLNREERLAGSPGSSGSEMGYVYTAKIRASRPVADYTPRVIPAHAEALIPLEISFILWHDSPSWR